jgi:hypothetical protein
MIDVSACKEYFEQVKEFALRTEQLKQLEEQLGYLGKYADHNNDGLTKCLLFRDFAPFSFEFVMQKKVNGQFTNWFNGGLIYHGSHDGNGSGSAPTFAVTLNSTQGWSVHT